MGPTFSALMKVWVLFLCCIVCSQAASYKSIGSFHVTNPAYLNYGYFTPSEAKDHNVSLIITSFSGSPLVKDSVHIVTDIGNYLNTIPSITPALVTNQVIWPNEATAVPFEIFQQPVMGMGNGFLPPGKQTGAVTLIPTGTNVPWAISAPKQDWFYHVAKWWDMDGDGLEDCVSARAYDDGSQSQGQLIWFKNPGSNPLGVFWEEHVLAEGPDIMIELVWLEGSPENAQPMIVASQFFSQKLTLWWVDQNSTWAESTPQSRVIDGQAGALFDTQYIDLNNDGKKDLLVTNHMHDANQAAVFAYTVPENWQTDPWPRYVLATNITTRKIGPNQASPGRAKAFHPNTTETDTKRTIIVGGDGAEVAFMLYPNSEDPNNWDYTREDIINTGCTVGQVEVGDTNGDNMVEFFVPAFEKNTVYAYTFGV